MKILPNDIIYEILKYIKGYKLLLLSGLNNTLRKCMIERVKYIVKTSYLPDWIANLAITQYNWRVFIIEGNIGRWIAPNGNHGGCNGVRTALSGIVDSVGWNWKIPVTRIRLLNINNIIPKCLEQGEAIMIIKEKSPIYIKIRGVIWNVQRNTF